MTSSHHVADLKGDNLYVSSALQVFCHSFNILGVKRWGPNQLTPPPSPVPEDQKNRSPPGQGKINVWALSDVSEKKGKHADLLDLLIECKKKPTRIH